MSRTQVAPGFWKDDGPSTPVRLRRSFAVVMADTIPSMRPVVSNGGNYISGGGRPAATAMHVVDEAEWRKREQNREAAQRYRERKSS